MYMPIVVLIEPSISDERGWLVMLFTFEFSSSPLDRICYQYKWRLSCVQVGRQPVRMTVLVSEAEMELPLVHPSC